MKYGKWICLAVLVFSLSVGLCSCGEQTTTTASTTSEDSAVAVDWKTTTCYETDSDGYRFEYTWNFSPWILEKNTDVTNAYWSDLVKKARWGDYLEEATLPSVDDWGLYKEDSYYSRDGFSAKMTDMYYCIGMVSIKNVTEGWSITSEQKKSPSITVSGDEPLLSTICDIYDCDSSDGLIMYYFSDDRIINYLGANYTASMDFDYWGPVAIVLMTPDYFSPNTPDGVTSPLLAKRALRLTGNNMIDVGMYE